MACILEKEVAAAALLSALIAGFSLKCPVQELFHIFSLSYINFLHRSAGHGIFKRFLSYLLQQICQVCCSLSEEMILVPVSVSSWY